MRVFGASSLGAFAVCLAIGGGAGFLMDDGGLYAKVQQPLAFDHLLHVDEVGLECAACHANSRSLLREGLPSNALCELCHLEPQGESAEELRLVELLQSGQPLEWKPLYRQPPHVFFSHRAHVVVAGLECTICHGDIGASTTLPERRNPLTMDQCIDCHAKNGASEHCSACHR